MATKSIVERNNKRTCMITKNFSKRALLKQKIKDKSTSSQERYENVVKLSEMPRNSSSVRLKNRCQLTGRPRGVYRKFKLCRNIIRDLASYCLIPGLVKASW